MIIFVLILILIAISIAFYFYAKKRHYLGKKMILTQQDYTVLFISVPKENEKTPPAAEALFAALHGIYKSKSESPTSTIADFVSFEIVAQKNQIKFYVFVPNHLRDFVEGQIYAQYPDIEIQEVEDYAKLPNEGQGFDYMGSELILNKEDVYPIKTYDNFDVDPLASITAVLSKVHKDEEIWMQIIVRPVSDEWQNKGISHVAAVKAGKSSGRGFVQIAFGGIWNLIKELFLTATQPEREAEKPGDVQLPGPVEAALTGAEEKIVKLGFSTKIRLIAVAENQIKARQRLHSAVGAFKQFNTTNMNGFQADKMRLNELKFLDDYQKRIFIDEGYILNITELASIFHLPNISVETPSIVWAGAKKGEPPADLPLITDDKPDPEITVFGITDFRGDKVKFGIKEDDRRRHMYLIGRTGVGKTNTMQNMVIDDMKAGRGVAVVDPHGDFIEYILNFIPDSRINDVVLFDPSDTEHPIGFNLLENVNPELKNIVSSGLIGIFKKLWIDSWGPRLEHILRNTILALLESPGETMLGIMKMLVDENYRREVVDRVQDPVIKDFWINEFERYDQKFRTEAVAPIQNKVGQFLSSSTIRNILGQPKSMIDIEDIMDNKKILLMNLSKGKIGEDNCALIGAMLITKIQITAMMRARIPEQDRVDFYLYVDEFQNFATESFAAILSEARKYHLNIIIANQYVTQMSEEVRDAVFGNVGTMITFRIGASDAPLLAKEYIPVFEETDLINLDKYHIYVKMSIDGVTTIPFSATNVPPYTETTNNHDKVVEQSRQKYGQPRELVEENIRKNNVSAVEKLLQEKQGDSAPKTAEQAPPMQPTPTQTTPKPQTTESSQTPAEKPAGFQEVTDTTGQKFYVLYREEEKKKEKKETPEPKQAPIPETKTKTPETPEEKPETKEEQKVKEIRKSIDTMYGEQKDEAGHTIIEEGETHEIKRDEDKTK
jgi:hypothetical protein